MRFGICTTVETAPAVKAAGWDFVEESIQGLFQGLLPHNEWTGQGRVKNSPVPVLAANMLVPAQLKITGPEANVGKLREYMNNVLTRAARLGTKLLVFGSGGARNVPDGFDRQLARQQILEFLRTVAPVAAQNGIMIVVEHLNKKECNIINSVAEAMEYVKAVNHPNIKCLVDSYHLWLENEPLESVKAALPQLRHVHLADVEGRVAPGLSGKNDYHPLFKVLRKGNYSGLISIECLNLDIAKDGQRVLEFLKQQWEES